MVMGPLSPFYPAVCADVVVGASTAMLVVGSACIGACALAAVAGATYVCCFWKGRKVEKNSEPPPKETAERMWREMRKEIKKANARTAQTPKALPVTVPQLLAMQPRIQLVYKVWGVDIMPYVMRFNDVTNRLSAELKNGQI